MTLDNRFALTFIDYIMAAQNNGNIWEWLNRCRKSTMTLHIAFANTSGGIILLGVKTERNRQRKQKKLGYLSPMAFKARTTNNKRQLKQLVSTID